MNEGIKDDKGKTRLDLLPPELMIAVGDILTSGAEKYTRSYENEWHSLLSASDVVSVLVITPNGSADVAMSEASSKPILLMRSVSGEIQGNGARETPKELPRWRNVEKIVQTLVREISEQSGSGHFGDMDSQNPNTQRCAPQAAQSVPQPNTCTLIIVTTQGNFEASFVPDAITDSDFWTTTWRGLKEQFDISRPVPQVGERNWERGMDWGRVYAALLRHLFAWWGGEASDPETGKSHLHHVGCCVAFLIAYEARGTGKDDRPGAGT